MKLSLLLSALVLTAASTAVAHPVIDVKTLTCGEAQAYANKYKRYYKSAGVDGLIPIGLPMTVSNPVPTCKSKERVVYIWESVLDQATCVLGYACVSA